MEKLLDARLLDSSEALGLKCLLTSCLAFLSTIANNSQKRPIARALAIAAALSNSLARLSR